MGRWKRDLTRSEIGNREHVLSARLRKRFSRAERNLREQLEASHLGITVTELRTRKQVQVNSIVTNARLEAERLAASSRARYTRNYGYY
jgi:hypothetical protein